MVVACWKRIELLRITEHLIVHEDQSRVSLFPYSSPVL